MAIDRRLQTIVFGIANRENITPAALLAVVEIESAGKAFEVDGVTPQLLFERHVFYRELTKLAPDKVAAAEAAELTRKSWDKATQYKDQGTSKGRLALIAQARAIDIEVANRSASWGLGQTMGFNAKMIGYASATLMVKAMADLPTQVECMIREIKRTNNTDNLRGRQWAEFARIYNGAGYRQNSYDTRLATAYAKWTKALDIHDVDITPDEAGQEIVKVDSRVAEAPPITQSTIANGSIAAGGSVAAGGGLIVADKISDKLIEKSGDLADKAADKIFTWPLTVGIVLVLVAIGACGYIYYKRWKLKQEAGV